MDFGALMFFTEYAVPANEFAQALEARGFESVWAPERALAHPGLAQIAVAGRRRAAQGLL